MQSHLFALLPVAFAAAVYLAIVVAFLVSLLAARWRGRGTREGAVGAAPPRVTILKPLAGMDDDLDANLASFGALRHPDFEILFGVASPSDPALAAARGFMAAHPHVRAQIVLTDPAAAMNPKVAQLLAMEAKATGELIVISDSNVRVRPDVLATLTTHLEDPEVGMVTSIVGGTGEQTLGAALENLHLCSVVAPAIVVHNLLSSSPLTLGKSMAMRRRDLHAVGGFAAVAHVLAEDYALGRLILAKGLKVRTSLAPVENRNVEGGVLRTFERHSRWAKMRRATAPFHYVFEPLASPLTMATIVFAISPTREQMLALVASALLQTVVGFTSVRVLRGTAMPWYYAPLEIVRTYVAFGVWAVAFVSRRVEWRGHAFLVGAGTALEPVPKAPSPRTDP